MTTTNLSSKAPHVLIIGAGTTGLLIAQGLKKSSIPHTIFESTTPTTYTTRPREWGMTLHWGSSHLSSLLPAPLLTRLPEAYADPTLSPDAVTGLPVYNGATGELVVEMGAERPMRVSRRKLRALVGEGLDVRYGMEVVSARVTDEDRVEVEFANGEVVTGDILIGADGAKSAVRGVLCGQEEAALQSVPVSMFNFPCVLPPDLGVRIRSMNPLFVTSVHPVHGGMFWVSILDTPTPSPSTWVFQILQSWLDSSVPSSTDLSTPAGRMALFKSRAATYAEPWRSVGLAVPDTTPILLDRSTYWSSPSRWANRGGRMTLAGDAAHPMTPHRGQGLNNAVQDAARFVAAMIEVAEGKVGLQEAVDGYDQEVWERGTLEVGISLKQTMGIHNWETLMQSPMVKMGMRQAKSEEV